MLSGLAHVTLLDTKDELWITEGQHNFIIAADTIGVGHITQYPLDKPTVALQIPLKDGILPDHHVVKQGACPALAAPELTEWTHSTSPQEILAT